MPEAPRPQPDWQTITLFVSSTFSDLHRERDTLRDIVIPELNRELRSRRCDVTHIDLRWGVNTASLPTPEEREREVLDVCLDAIDRTRPFFLVLLGDRYGWVPPTDRVAVALDGTGVEPGERPWSVTHLEIEYGLLTDADAMSNGVALIRTGLPYEEMGDTAASYCDALARDVDATVRAEALDALKARLKKDLGERYVEYRATWAGGHVDGLDGDFATRAIAALWQVLDHRTRDRRRMAPLDANEAEALAVEHHWHRARVDVGGSDPTLDQLLALAVSGQNVLVVAGAGAGKSTLLARLVDELRARPDATLVLDHAAGVTPASVRPPAIVARWAAQLSALLGDVVPDPADPGGEFASLLRRAAESQPVVLVLDGLDELGAEAAARRLAWLPEPLPEGVTVVTSASPSPNAVSIGDRPGWSTIPVEPLDGEDARALVRQATGRRHRTLPTPVEAAIVGRRDGDRRTPLWLRLVVDELLELSHDDYRASVPARERADVALERLLLDTVNRLPGTLDGLYAEVFGRVASAIDRDVVPTVLRFLSVSRRGLRERDLAKIVERRTGTWDPVPFARLRRRLDAHLVEQDDGRLDFAHRPGRRAAGRLGPADETIGLHRVVADVLTDCPEGDPVRTAELAYHLIHSSSLDDLADLLAAPVSREQAAATAQAVADELVARRVAGGLDAAVEWLRSVVGDHRDDLAAVRAATELVAIADTELAGRLSIDDRIELIDAASTVLGHDWIELEDRVFRRRLHAQAKVRAAMLLDDAGRYDLAESVLHEAREMLEDTRERLRVSLEVVPCPACGQPCWAEGLFTEEAAEASIPHLAHAAVDDPSGEIRAMLRQLAVEGAEPDLRRDLSFVHDRLGEAHMARAAAAEARHHHELALDLRRSCLVLLDDAARAWGEDLPEAAPLRAATTRAVGESLSGIARALELDGDTDAAESRLIEAIEALDDARVKCPEEPTTALASAEAHRQLARLCERAGNLVAAEEHDVRAEALAGPVLAGAPDDASRVRDRLGALTDHLATARHLLHRDEINAMTEQALWLAREAGRVGADDVPTAGRRWEALFLASEQALHAGDLTGAESLLHDALELCTGLEATMDHADDARRARGATLARLAQVRVVQARDGVRDWSEATDCAEQAVAILRELDARGQASVPVGGDLVEALGIAASLRQERGDRDGALAYLDDALATISTLPDSPQARRQRAVVTQHRRHLLLASRTAAAGDQVRATVTDAADRVARWLRSKRG